MLGFQFLLLDLIFSNGILVTRPVEIDHVTCARVFQSWLTVVQSALADGWKFLVTVTTSSELILRENAICTGCSVDYSQCTVKSTAAKIDVAIFMFLTSFLSSMIIDNARSIPVAPVFVGA